MRTCECCGKTGTLRKLSRDEAVLCQNCPPGMPTWGRRPEFRALWQTGAFANDSVVRIPDGDLVGSRGRYVKWAASRALQAGVKIKHLDLTDYMGNRLMATNKRVLTVGDVHGEWWAFNEVIALQQPDHVFCLGDFGFWPKPAQRHLCPTTPGVVRTNYAPGKSCEIRFLDGNHENFKALRRISPVGSLLPVEIAPGVIYQPRGSTWRMPDGRVALFVGGAKSVDWKLRKPGFDWFPGELLTLDELPRPLPRADVVFSHTAPAAFGLPSVSTEMAEYGWDLAPDPSCEVLDIVLAEAKPKEWYFGHFHEHIKGETAGCRWEGLAQLPGTFLTSTRWVTI